MNHTGSPQKVRKQGEEGTPAEGGRWGWAEMGKQSGMEGGRDTERERETETER